MVLQFRGVRRRRLAFRDAVALTLPCAMGSTSSSFVSTSGLETCVLFVLSSIFNPCLPTFSGARTWSGEREGGSEGAEEDVLGIRRERRARATRRCGRGRAGGARRLVGRRARAEKRAIRPEKADGKRRVPRVDALVLAPEVHTIRSLLQGLWWEPGMIAMGRTDARVAAMTWRRVCATMLMLVGRAGCACASSN